MAKITSEELQAMVDRAVDELPQLSAEQCQKVATVLQASGVLR